MKLAEENGDNGKVSECEATMRKADEVKVWLDEMKRMHTTEFQGEEVCEVCGARMQREGAVVDERSKALVFEHYDGKIHRGFASIRMDIERIKKEMSAETEDFSPMSRSRSREKEKTRDRSRDKK